MGRDSAGGQKAGRDALVPELPRVRPGEGDAGRSPADSDRARHARHGGPAIERGSAGSARARAEERTAGRGREDSGRQSSARAGDDRRVRGVPDAGRKAPQRGSHERDRDVATENIRADAKIAAHEESLARALELARAYIRSRGERPVWPTVSVDELRAALGGPLPDHPNDPTEVVEALARAAEPGLVTTTGPRYFGFVTGGALPATVAAEWLTTAWDQNPGLFVMSPAGAVVEEIAGAWLLDLLRLPADASVGFVTGCHMANFTGLAAARHEVLRRAGWDVEADGLSGAPPLRVVAGDEVHVSVIGALRMLGIGSRQIVRVAADDQGRMRPDALEAVLGSSSARFSADRPPTAEPAPTIVCAQSGNVNTGAFDPLDEIAPIVERHGGWLHVDGAFGLWASASEALRRHTRGVELADSWAT